MMPLTKEERKIHRNRKNAIYAKKDLVLMIKMKSIIRLETIVVILENTEVMLMISAI